LDLTNEMKHVPKLGMHIEVCGSEKYDYEYRDRTYQKNGHHVIFIHAYKCQKQRKKFLLEKNNGNRGMNYALFFCSAIRS